MVRMMFEAGVFVLMLVLLGQQQNLAAVEDAVPAPQETNQ